MDLFQRDISNIIKKYRFVFKMSLIDCLQVNVTTEYNSLIFTVVDKNIDVKHTECYSTQELKDLLATKKYIDHSILYTKNYLLSSFIKLDVVFTSVFNGLNNIGYRIYDINEIKPYLQSILDWINEFSK